MKKRIYLTTTLPYINAPPHIGFALEIVQADAFARFKRLSGHQVFFNFGTDEHGQKILKAAEKEGLSPQTYADKLAPKFDNLKKALNLSYDNFIRTTDEHHIKAARHIWKLADKNGDIYKKKYRGLYCLSCERFVKEGEIKEDGCPNHPGRALEEVQEENYFFRFGKYQDFLLEYLNDPKTITPKWRREEAINFVKEGLEDFPISRLKSRMTWGVPVPEDDEHVMYVWFDALVNYISALGWPGDEKGNFKKFWEDGETIQFAGKDQVRFQSLMWQAMLKSVGVKNTDKVFYHGFINLQGKKISKSIGNVVDPFNLVKEFGADALRYYLLRHVSPVEDSNFSEELLKEAYNANLANGLGNLSARVLTLAQNNLKEAVEVVQGLHDKDYTEAFENFDFNKAVNIVWKNIQDLDKTIAELEPYKIVKENPEGGREIIRGLVTGLLEIANRLEPVMPETSKSIKDAIKKNKRPKNLFPRK